jgi:cell division protein FtsX
LRKFLPVISEEMKKVLIITGCIVGILFSIWDSMMNYADGAPLNNEFGIEIISWHFFLKKTFIYILIGFITGWLVSLIIKKYRKFHE